MYQVIAIGVCDDEAAVLVHTFRFEEDALALASTLDGYRDVKVLPVRDGHSYEYIV